jgi:SNF2 family DNA or RNA helicase
MPTLYPFQQQAVDFLLPKKSCLLGDDMGLGKTPQAVVLDSLRRVQQPNLVKKPKTLVITYLSVLSSWQDHYQDWAPDLRVCPIDNKNRIPFLKAIASDEADVFICHWQGLRILVTDELFKRNTWFNIIADECHALQDRKSQQTKALKSLKTWYKTGLSGTPAFDKPDDLWSILNWLYPEYWRSYWKYYNRHIIYTDFSGYRTIVGVAHANELQQQMAGFYIRRRKEEVLLDLPEKYNTRIEVDLSPKQEKAYESMRKDMLAWVGEHEDEPVSAPVVIAQLTRLQQFSDAFGEIDRETGKMLVSEPSSKLDAVMQVIHSTNEQVVIFSQFSQVIKLLGKRLTKSNIPHGIFIGDTSGDDRKEIIKNFQAGRLKVFAGTIAAGGVGITLTASSTIIFIDRSWSPSLNRQAEDRLHRIGQKNAVQVIDILSRGTIDAKRHEEIELKWSWVLELLGEKDET